MCTHLRVWFACAQKDGEPAVVVLFTWLRFMATRQLVWNKNYNVKPREISAAQNALTATMCRYDLAATQCLLTSLTWQLPACVPRLHRDRPDLRDIVRLTMCTVGRGAWPAALCVSQSLCLDAPLRMLPRRHGRHGAAHPRRDPGHSAPQPRHGRLHGGTPLVSCSITWRLSGHRS